MRKSELVWLVVLSLLWAGGVMIGWGLWGLGHG